MSDRNLVAESRSSKLDVFRYAKEDVAAGFVVFLVALPLCLGIALASEAPLASGILTGVIAGIVVSWLSGSHLSVSGPAAGLTLTVTASIALLGSFESLLVAIFIAGLLQIIFGLCRLGTLASFFPHSVIKGMLAAIGLIIILKQIPHAVGWDVDFEGNEAFLHAATPDNTFSGIAHAFQRLSPGAVAVSVTAFLALLFWGSAFIRSRKNLKSIPPPLVAVLVGLAVNEFLRYFAPGLALTGAEGKLVTLPSGGLTGFLAQLPVPRWDALYEGATWKVAVTIGVIATIESLLSVEAVDKIDPDRRSSDTNRELIAQGTGNILCGLFGGIPMTSVIVRSSANVYAGGRTRLSCFVHGVFLMAAVLFLAGVLNRIPLAALAAVLISVGFKLVSLDIIRKTIAEGFEQALPFFVTMVAIVCTDLLTGVCIGLVVGLTIVIRMNHHSALTQVSNGNDILIRFAKDVSFFHKPALKEMLANIPGNSNVLIDGTAAQFIDHDIVEAVRDFVEGAPHRNLHVTCKGLRSKRMSVKGIRNGHVQESFVSQQSLGPRKT